MPMSIFSFLRREITPSRMTNRFGAMYIINKYNLFSRQNSK